MTQRNCLILIICIGSLLLLSCTDSTTSDDTQKKGPTTESKSLTKKITIVHPGDPDSRALDYELLIDVDRYDSPLAFHIWVDSVICRDETCDVVKVKLTWNQFGQYQSYEVEPGEKLTKLDHIPFTKEDHQHLQKILLDTNSPLSEVSKEGLTGPKKNAAVDGVAGATLLTLASTVVVGAGYTCYDLWHWANGEMINIIREYSSDLSSKGTLISYLHSDDQHTIQFALEALSKRAITDKSVNAVLTKKLVNGNDALIKPGTSYLRMAYANTPEYYHVLADIFNQLNAEKQIIILNELKVDGAAGPEEFYDKISIALSNMQNHHEVHLFFTMLEAEAIWSDKIATNAVKLLQHEKFFVARRAYWNLIKYKLPDDVQAQVDAFAKKHKDRL